MHNPLFSKKLLFALILFTAVSSSNLSAQTSDQSDTGKLDAIDIKTYKRSKSESAMIKDVRSASLTVSGISMELIKNIQVSSANDVVKRVPGVSILGDKFLVVRGISPRYNLTWLNGFTAPSFNPDNKVFSYDILPASVIDNMKLFKTMSAELPADFAGGMVKLETISMPDNSEWNLSVGVGYDGITTFKPFLSQNQRDPKYLGLNYNANDLPEAIKNRHLDADPRVGLTERIKITSEFNNNFDPETETAPMNLSFSLDKKFKFKSKNFAYGSTHLISYRDIYTYNVFRRSTITTIPERARIINFSDAIYNNQKIVTVLNNFTIALKNGLRIDWKNLFVNDANYSVLHRQGKSLEGAYGDNGLYQFTSFLQDNTANTFRNFLNSSLIYYYTINKKLQLDGNFGLTFSNYLDQDRKSTLRMRNDDPTGAAASKVFSVSTVSTMDQLRFGRWFYSLPENTFEGALNFNYELNKHSKLLTGVYAEMVSRKFDLRCLGMVSKVWNADSITPEGSYSLIDEYTWPYNSYTAKSTKIAAYISYKLNYLKHNLNLGARFESFNFDIQSEGFQSALNKDRLLLGTMNVFPSLNYSYVMNETSQIRFATAISCNRPEFRELSPLSYLDIENWLTANGNSNIKPISLIYNGDVRYEYYNGKTMFHFGLFWKKTDNPVITKMTDANRYKFDNASYALNYGAEFEYRFETNSFIKNTRSKFRNIDVLLNGTYSFSNLWGYGDSGVIIDLKQPMVGQSPFTVNVMCFYNIPRYGIKLGLSYFKQGDRVIFIGDNSSLYSLNEKVASNLDLTIEKMITKKFNVRMRIVNILNNQNVIYQDLNNNGKLDSYDGYIENLDSDNIYNSSKNILGINITASLKF